MHTFPSFFGSACEWITVSRPVSMQMNPTHHYGGEGCNRGNSERSCSSADPGRITCWWPLKLKARSWYRVGLKKPEAFTLLSRCSAVARVEFWVISWVEAWFDMTFLVFLRVEICFRLKLHSDSPSFTSSCSLLNYYCWLRHEEGVYLSKSFTRV